MVKKKKTTTAINIHESFGNTKSKSTPPTLTATNEERKKIKRLQKIQPWLWVGIFIQSLVATVGSLYYSTFGDIAQNISSGNPFPVGEGLIPCTLCWFARILMYPLVLSSYIAIAKKDQKFTDYVLPVAVIGVILESYHYALQKLPIQTLFGCSLENPCSALQVNYWGFITIPFLALIAFLVILVLASINTYINWRVEQANLSQRDL